MPESVIHNGRESFGRMDFTGAIGFAAADGSHNSALMGGWGTTADPATTAVADKNFFELRTQSTATSGTSRNTYLRHDLAGAGADGEALRVVTDLTAAVTTARGTQISVQAGSTGYVSGLAAAVDAQLYVKNSVLPANGTYTALKAEIYSAGSTTAVSAVTDLSYLHIANGGDATGVGRVDDKARLFSIYGHTVGAGNMIVASTTEANYSHAIKIYVDGVGELWLMLASASG